MSDLSGRDGIKLPSPPALAARCLRLLLPADCSAVLGDFSEAYFAIAAAQGARRAGRWYWHELFRSLPALSILFVSHKRKRIPVMTTFSHSRRVALIGAVCTLPALLLVTSGLIFSATGTELFDTTARPFNLIDNPMLLLGGLLVTFVLNALPVVRVRVQYQERSLTSTLTLRTRTANLALLILCTLLGAAILVYGLVENFEVVAR